MANTDRHTAMLTQRCPSLLFHGPRVYARTWLPCTDRRRSGDQRRWCDRPCSVVQVAGRRVLQMRAQETEHRLHALVGAAGLHLGVVVEGLVPGDAGRFQMAEFQLPLCQQATTVYARALVHAGAEPVRLLHGFDGSGLVAEFVTHLADVVVERRGVVGAECLSA